MTTSPASEEIIPDRDYACMDMPNGKFVGEVYMKTHDVIKALDCTDCSNEQFMDTEKLIRDYVWMACKRARNTRAPQASESVEDNKFRCMNCGEREVVKLSPHEDWSMVVGDWKDKVVAVHGKNGLIACGLPEQEARKLIDAHNQSPKSATNGERQRALDSFNQLFTVDDDTPHDLAKSILNDVLNVHADIIRAALQPKPIGMEVEGLDEAIAIMCEPDPDNGDGDHPCYQLRDDMFWKVVDAAKLYSQSHLGLPQIQEGWNDISTAPKDGTKFTGYSPTLGVRRGVSFNEQRQDFDIGFSCLIRDWTHWQPEQPLPAAPTPPQSGFGDELEKVEYALERASHFKSNNGQEKIVIEALAIVKKLRGME